VLAERPELMRADTAAGSGAESASLSVAIREGRQTFEEAGGPRAYFGAPAEATARRAAPRLEALGKILEESVTEALAARGAS
jgi:creatinine amidohydrolase